MTTVVAAKQLHSRLACLVLFGSGAASQSLTDPLVLPGDLTVGPAAGEQETVDIARGMDGSSASFSLLTNDGTGQCTARTDAPYTMQGYDLVADDFDGDGLTDLASGMAFTTHVSLFRNQGCGCFVAGGEAETGCEPRSVLAVDPHGDGDRGLAMADDGLGGLASMSVMSNETSCSSATAICFGDGTGVWCPCTPGSPGVGCASFSTSSAKLVASGDPLFSNHSFASQVSELPVSTPGLCFKGSAIRRWTRQALRRWFALRVTAIDASIPSLPVHPFLHVSP